MTNELSEYVQRHHQKAFSLSPEIPVRQRIEIFLRGHPKLGVEPKIDGARMFLMTGEKNSVLASKHNGVIPAPDHLVVPRHSIFDCEYKRDTKQLFIFDVLRLADADLTYLNYRDRRDALRAAKMERPFNVRILDYQIMTAADHIEAAYDDALSRGYEGVMAKDATSYYGQPSTWLKLKLFETVDLVVVAPVPGKQDCWRVGAFDEKRNLVEVSDASSPKKEVDVSKIKPGSVLEVRYQPTVGYTALRHPTIIRIRSDKTPEECTVDQMPWLVDQGKIEG